MHLTTTNSNQLTQNDKLLTQQLQSASESEELRR